MLGENPSAHRIQIYTVCGHGIELRLQASGGLVSKQGLSKANDWLFIGSSYSSSILPQLLLFVNGGLALPGRRLFFGV